MTAVAVLHNTEVRQYPSLPDLHVVAQATSPVRAYLVRCARLLLQRSAVPDGPVPSTWARAPLYLARAAVVSLNWRPLLVSKLKCGTHVELREFVRGLECLLLRTRRMVPFLIDMKIFYALLKMSYGPSCAPWHVDQFLLGHPLMYGMWHAYKYSVEMTHKAFIPIVKFVGQGWDVKVKAVVPLKLKLRHMDKTIVGLLLATAANKARLDGTTQVLLDNYRDLTDVQRVGLRCLLGLEALLYSYRPALLALGVLVGECNWNGRTASSTTAAKECIVMSIVLFMHIIPCDKWLTAVYPS